MQLVGNVGCHNYSLVAPCLGHVVALGLVVMKSQYRFDRHRCYLTQQQYTQFLKYSYGEWIQTLQTLILTICLLLLAIPVNKYFMRPLQGPNVFLIVTNIIFTYCASSSATLLPGRRTRRDWRKVLPTLSSRELSFLKRLSPLYDFALASFPLSSFGRFRLNCE